MDFKDFCNAVCKHLSEVSLSVYDPVFSSGSFDGRVFSKCTIEFTLGMISGLELGAIHRLLGGSGYGFYITDINGLSLVIYGAER